LLILALLASALGCVSPGDTALIGFWESEATSQGGIGHTLELKADGELVTSFTVMVDGVYRATAGSLFIAENAKALAETTDGTRFTITQNLFVYTDSDGQEVRKERLGVQPRASTPLVGDWRYRHDTGAIAYERYTDDGRLLFRLPMGSWQGCYRAASGSFSMSTPQVNSTMQYTLASGRLTLREGAGKSSAYRRAEPWYPRDLLDYQPPKTK
jgi:outer membrane protein assembly factor BamB